MQLIEAALAFAITMLVLSLIVSSFVELIHRVLSMREAGLKYMLGQMFDQVLKKYLTDEKVLALVNGSLPEGKKITTAPEAWNVFRNSFVERMSANRAPMGVTPNATPNDAAAKVDSNRMVAFSLWSGRDLSAMTPTEFMERLGSIDVGKVVAEANKVANDAFKDTANAAADMADAVLKDVAQKFEAFGKEASAYFEGRARLLSVVVAIALAFAAHVDAVDLFRTYLRDPNARAKVIEQAEAVTAQHKAAAEAAAALDALKGATPETAEQIKQHVEALKEDWKAAINGAKGTIKQYADLGTPIGWTDERVGAAKMKLLLWTCKDPTTGESEGLAKLGQECPKDAQGYTGLKGRQYVDVWVQIPMKPSTWFFLFLGGLLIGLGSPFWYGAVSGLTQLRNGARGTTAENAPSLATATATQEITKAQPVTPAGAFQVSTLAQR